MSEPIVITELSGDRIGPELEQADALPFRLPIHIDTSETAAP